MRLQKLSISAVCFAHYNCQKAAKKIKKAQLKPGSRTV